MERLKPHKKLDLWGKIIDLVVFLYEITKPLPREEEFGLKAQIRRAGVSVPSNVSEGLTRKTKKDKTHFLNMAQSSLSEIDAQIEVSRRLGFISKATEVEANERLSTVEMMLSGLVRSISSREAANH
ncbi:MAG TPA: four helix bundle protein [Bacteroidota bacterium]|nr:four helix bundle protein [Bacteroidota bacterium]